MLTVGVWIFTCRVCQQDENMMLKILHLMDFGFRYQKKCKLIGTKYLKIWEPEKNSTLFWKKPLTYELKSDKVLTGASEFLEDDESKLTFFMHWNSAKGLQGCISLFLFEARVSLPYKFENLETRTDAVVIELASKNVGFYISL